MNLKTILNTFCNWSSGNGQHFNLQKAQYLIIGIKGSDKENELKVSSAVNPALVTDHGLIKNEHLKWGRH